MDKDRVLKKLGRKIREARENAGYSQEDFAYKFDFGRSYFSAVENGRCNITVIQLIRIAHALKIDPCELLE